MGKYLINSKYEMKISKNLILICESCNAHKLPPKISSPTVPQNKRNFGKLKDEEDTQKSRTPGFEKLAIKRVNEGEDSSVVIRELN